MSEQNLSVPSNREAAGLVKDSQSNEGQDSIDMGRRPFFMDEEAGPKAGFGLRRFLDNFQQGQDFTKEWE